MKFSYKNGKMPSQNRSNIKLPRSVFLKLKALNKVLPLMQYELVEELLDEKINNLSEQQKEFYDYQLKKLVEQDNKKE